MMPVPRATALSGLLPHAREFSGRLREPREAFNERTAADDVNPPLHDVGEHFRGVFQVPRASLR